MITAERIVELGEEYVGKVKDTEAVDAFFAEQGIPSRLIAMLSRQMTTGIVEATDDQDIVAAAAWMQGFGFALYAADMLRAEMRADG